MFFTDSLIIKTIVVLVYAIYDDTHVETQKNKTQHLKCQIILSFLHFKKDVSNIGDKDMQWGDNLYNLHLSTYIGYAFHHALVFPMVVALQGSKEGKYQQVGILQALYVPKGTNQNNLSIVGLLNFLIHVIKYIELHRIDGNQDQSQYLLVLLLKYFTTGLGASCSFQECGKILVKNRHYHQLPHLVGVRFGALL